MTLELSFLKQEGGGYEANDGTAEVGDFADVGTKRLGGAGVLPPGRIELSDVYRQPPETAWTPLCRSGDGAGIRRDFSVRLVRRFNRETRNRAFDADTLQLFRQQSLRDPEVSRGGIMQPIGPTRIFLCRHILRSPANGSPKSEVPLIAVFGVESTGNYPLAVILRAG